MKHSHSVDKLAKMLVYMLGRQPDEFGLCPNENGYVKIKDLLKALGEEPGWRHVRLHQIREVLYTTHTPMVEMATNLIRAVDRSSLFSPEIPATLPKLLYYPIRQRAYPVVLEKGLPPGASRCRIILADDLVLAHRLGRRIDPSPVILTVNSDKACKYGATIWLFGKQLFLSDCLPPGSFSGPPLPKNRPELKKVNKSEPQDAPKTPGSYHLDLAIAQPAKSQANKGSRQRKNDWKRARKKMSRNNDRRWTDK
jgi:putative RNA 2'-phosphotransferase